MEIQPNAKIFLLGLRAATGARPGTGPDSRL